MLIIGDVKGKDVVIVDDMVDTAGTLTKAADLMIEKGANSVRACCTHGIFSSNAYEKIDKSSLVEVYTTNNDSKKSQIKKKINELLVYDLFADTIKGVVDNRSISKNFIF